LWYNKKASILRRGAFLLEWFCPDIFIKDIHQLTPEFLKNFGIKGIIIDLDNTLVAWNQKKVDEKLLNWFKVMKSNGIKLCIVSNNKQDRVVAFAESVGIPAVYKAVKPRRRAFKKGLSILNTGVNDTAVVGDQIFTDIYGARRLGLFTILVKPISQKEFWWTRLVRNLERRVIQSMVYKGILKPPS
jgi:HAD superfamily phosphatase (TIGR01668 family)